MPKIRNICDYFFIHTIIYCKYVDMVLVENLHRCRGIYVINATQPYSIKPEPRFRAGSNPALRVSEICDVENLWQWSRLEIRLNAFRQSTISQKHFNIISSSPSSQSPFIIITLIIPIEKWGHKLTS